MRARNIKPGFFLDEDLAELPFEARILFAGLWCAADKAGRLELRPKRIKAQIFPYDPIDTDDLIDRLCQSGHLTAYSVGGELFLQINNFEQHQHPHHTEKESTIPPCDGDATVISPCDNGYAPSDSGRLKTEDGFLKTEKPRRGERTVEDDPGFLRFWAAYPSKVGKGAARKAWKKARISNGKLDQVLAAVEAQKNSPRWLEGIIPNPSTWLNQERWEDEAPKSADQIEAERHAERIAAMEKRIAEREASRNALR